MDKLPRDRDGEIFQDDLTENESKPRGSRRDDTAHDETMVRASTPKKTIATWSKTSLA